MLAAIGGAVAGSLLKGGISSFFGKQAADQEYEYNRRLQEHNFDFQREMRDTQYQATVEDMKKAGINPAVALSGGAAQSQAAGGSSASVGVQAPDTGSMEGLMGAIQQTALTKAQKENIEADTELKDKQSGKTEAETKTENLLRDTKLELTKAQTAKEKAATKTELSKKLNLDFDARMREMEVQKRSREYSKELDIYKARIQQEMIEAGYDSGTIAQVIKSIGKSVEAVSPFIGLTGRSNSQQKTYGYITTY